MALDKTCTTLVTLVQDNAFGKDGVKAFREAVKKAKIAHKEYLPAATTGFTSASSKS